MRIEVKKAVVENIFKVRLYTKEEIEEIKRRQQEELEAQLAEHQRLQEEMEKEKSLFREVGQKLGEMTLARVAQEKKFKHCHGA